MVCRYRYKSTREEYLTYVLEIVGLYMIAVQKYVEVPPDIEAQESKKVGDRGTQYEWRSGYTSEQVSQRLNELGYGSFSPVTLKGLIDSLGLEFLKFRVVESDLSLYSKSEAARRFEEQIFRGLNDKEFFIVADVFIFKFSTFSNFKVFTGLERFYICAFNRDPGLYPDLYRDARLRFFDFRLEFKWWECLYTVRQANLVIDEVFPDIAFRFIPEKYEQFEQSMKTVLESPEEGKDKVFSRKGKYKWVFYFLESLFGPLTEIQIRQFLYRWCCSFERGVVCTSASNKVGEIFMENGGCFYITWDDNLLLESIEEDPDTLDYYFTSFVPDECVGMTKKEQDTFINDELLDFQGDFLEEFWIYRDANMKEKVLNSIGHIAYKEYRENGGFDYERDRFSS